MVRTVCCARRHSRPPARPAGPSREPARSLQMSQTVAAGVPAAPSAAPPSEEEPSRSNAYNIFMLVLTVMSLAMMALLLMPFLTQAERDMLLVYDNAVCVVFLIDFGLNLRRSNPKRDYFIGRRGWLDLIGSIPTFGVFN